MEIKFHQIAKGRGIMGIHFETRKKFGTITYVNLKQCDESSIFINNNGPFCFVNLHFNGL